MLEDDLESRKCAHDRLQTLFDEALLAVEDVDLIVRHLAVHQER